MSTERLTAESESCVALPPVRASWPAVLLRWRRHLAVRRAQAAGSAAPIRRSREMRGGYAVGIAVSAAGHLGGLFLFNGDTSSLSARSSPAPVAAAEVMVMPPIEPETPLEVVEKDAADVVPELAPPSLFDLPDVAPVSAFVQMIRPVPPSLTGVPTLTVIPSHRGGFAEGPAVRLFEIAELDRVPRRLKTVTPVYPTEMKRARIQGEVQLVLVIDESGRVTVEGVKDSTARAFTDAAIAAVEQCVFESPMKNGQRVRARYSMRVPFILP